MKLDAYKNEKGESVANHPDFHQLLKDFKWAVERVKSYANSKAAHNNVSKAEALLEKYELAKIQ